MLFKKKENSSVEKANEIIKNATKNLIADLQDLENSLKCYEEMQKDTLTFMHS